MDQSFRCKSPATEQDNRLQGAAGRDAPKISKASYRVQFLGASPSEITEVVHEGKREAIPHIQPPEKLENSTHVRVVSPHATPDWTERTSHAALSAQGRASRLASRLSSSAPSSRRASIVGDYFSLSVPKATLSQPYVSPPLRPLADHPIRIDDICLSTLDETSSQRPYDIKEDTSDDDNESEPETVLKFPIPASDHVDEARRLVRTLTNGMPFLHTKARAACGTVTPSADKKYHQTVHDIEYVPPPDQYKPSVLSSILFSKLAQRQPNPACPSPKESFSSGSGPLFKLQTPKVVLKRTSLSGPILHDNATSPSHGKHAPSRKPKWHEKSPSHSFVSSTNLFPGTGIESLDFGSRASSISSSWPSTNRTRSSMIATAVDMIKHPISHNKNRNNLRDHVVQLEHQITDILERRKYLLRLCRALMVFGAPTHRMEEYMITSARALLVQSSFQYLPNCMIVAFDDPDTHTTEVHLVKEAAAIDLGKFKEAFDVYKNVIHGVYSAAEALTELQEIFEKKQRYPPCFLVPIYGIAAVSVGPFAFSARPIDFPIIFLLGCVLGFLQHCVAPRSAQFAHVFEVAAAVFISFTARGFGSIQYHGISLFCFPAIAQSSICLILPGWMVLWAALELQSRNLVAGSIRMVYAIIYTLFLGFGILIGTTLMGLIYPGATDELTCPMPWWWSTSDRSWRLIYTDYVWVPIFTVCLAMIHQATGKQMIPMIVISLCGYEINYWAGKRFYQNIQVANACGAFVIGAMANLYSRFFHGLAAAAMLPAIFVQVPSGLAASGSLVAGLVSADQLTQNSSRISVMNNGTQGFLDVQNELETALVGGAIFNMGYGMVQVAIGISVGLFLSALVVYPFGKRRSGLFSF